MNLIMRMYDSAEQLLAHKDSMQWGEEIYGIILASPEDGKATLEWQRGGEKIFKLGEKKGTVFKMEKEARYVWQHAVPKVSVPCRRCRGLLGWAEFEWQWNRGATVQQSQATFISLARCRVALRILYVRPLHFESCMPSFCERWASSWRAAAAFVAA